MSKDNNKSEEVLINSVYDNLMKVSKEIQESEETNPKLLDSFDSLLGTYFDIIDDDI